MDDRQSGPDQADVKGFLSWWPYPDREGLEAYAAPDEEGAGQRAGFLFQEGYDGIAENCFRQIAKLSGGAYCRFDSASASTLRNLLRAVAAYAAGGRRALSDLSKKSGGEARLLLEQIK